MPARIEDEQPQISGEMATPPGNLIEDLDQLSQDNWRQLRMILEACDLYPNLFIASLWESISLKREIPDNVQIHIDAVTKDNQVAWVEKGSTIITISGTAKLVNSEGKGEFVIRGEFNPSYPYSVFKLNVEVFQDGEWVELNTLPLNQAIRI